MNFLLAFLCGGFICLIGQILLDKFKLLPLHITVIFVMLGATLELFEIYDKLIKFGNAGFLVPISSFGHSLAHAAYVGGINNGIIGVFTNVFETTAGGISVAVLAGFICSLIFKVKS